MRSIFRVGDASIPSYDLPNPRLQALGQRYSGRGTSAARAFVAPYASGDQFAARYGQSRFGNMCQNLQVSKTGQSEPTMGRGTNGTRITAGWAGFTCTENGRPTDAYVYAETLEVLPTFGSAGKWYVIVLVSAIAPEKRAKEAGDLLLHVYKSVRLKSSSAARTGRTDSGSNRWRGRGLAVVHLGLQQPALQLQKEHGFASQGSG